LSAVAETNRALLETDIELRASRRRVIAAGDGERVRIERDIHDGAQQRLVALAVQLQLASQLARNGTPVTPEQLDAMHVDSREALEELRALARGIYPSVLTERGLEDALRSAAARPTVPVTVHIDEGIDLPRNDAAAVYFICLEAMQNAAKHAPDSSARLSVRRSDDGGYVVAVVDDGPGFDTSSTLHSRGLLNMADRAGALGGELTVESEPGTGTCVTVTLPPSTAANVVA
jgi:signal transduction histidine kinase